MTKHLYEEFEDWDDTFDTYGDYSYTGGGGMSARIDEDYSGGGDMIDEDYSGYGNIDYSFLTIPDSSPADNPYSGYEPGDWGSDTDLGAFADATFLEEEDERSPFKMAQDYVFNIAKYLGITPKALKFVQEFAAAAAGKDKEGGGKRTSGQAKSGTPGTGRANQMTGARKATEAVIAQSSRAQSGADYLKNQNMAAGRDALANLQSPSGPRGQTIDLPGPGALNQLKISSDRTTKVA